MDVYDKFYSKMCYLESIFEELGEDHDYYAHFLEIKEGTLVPALDELDMFIEDCQNELEKENSHD